MIARNAALANWTSVLRHAMQTEIGRQLRSEFGPPQELPTELAGSLGRLDQALALAKTARAEKTARTDLGSRCTGEDRRRRLLLRAVACEEAAGAALNEGIKEIYLDLAAQWRDLAHRDQLFSMGAAGTSSDK